MARFRVSFLLLFPFLVSASPPAPEITLYTYDSLVAKGGLDRAEVLATRVTPSDEITPYHRFGDILLWLALSWVIWTSYRAAAGSRSIFIGSRSST